MNWTRINADSASFCSRQVFSKMEIRVSLC